MARRPQPQEIQEIKKRLDALEGKEKPEKSLIHIVLDRSGSMDSIWTDVKGGFDKFIREQRDLNCDVTLSYFDDQFGTAFVNAPIKSVKKLSAYKEVHPRGSTALYDAVGKGIEAVKEKAKQYDKIVFVVYTDGLENASHEFTSAKVKSLIKRYRNKWQFVYLGSNQDAWAVGTGLGFYGYATMSYAPTAGGVGMSTGQMTNSVGTYLRGQSNTVALSPDAEDAEAVTPAP